jgi:uncharacterized protein
LPPINYLSPSIYIRKTKKAGRGVFTNAFLQAGTLIEKSPVIVMNPEDRYWIDKTLLHDYIFEWGEGGRQCCMALGYVPLYNHSYHSNCEYEMDFARQTISVKTVQDVKAGAELLINYNGDWDNPKPVWFDVK